MQHDSSVSPWHVGEKRLQVRAGVSARMDTFGPKVIRDHMPEQHRSFFHQLPFMVAGTVDARGRPWATLLEGPEGFVESPDPRHLSIRSQPGADDPAAQGLLAGESIGLLGIELHTRRRNRLNGVLGRTANGVLEVEVRQSFGNCPQYIQLRDYVRVVQPAGPAQASTTLDRLATAMIESADTFFVASYYTDPAGQRAVDVSHRGGRPGFVRVEGNRLTVPDFAGNLHFNTLGNLLENPQAGLLFVDFISGDVLQVYGHAEVILDSPLIEAFKGAERLWTVDIEQVVRRPSALTLRWAFDAYSPTSLSTGTWDEAEREVARQRHGDQWLTWQVGHVEQESQDIRSFDLISDAPVTFAAGQHLPVRVVLPGEVAPAIRTYSLSTAPSDRRLRISIKAQGRVSRHLHEHLKEGDRLEVRLPVGSFTLDSQSPRPLVLIAAGVGITPLLAMLREQLAQGHGRRIHLFQGARNLAQLPFQPELAELQAKAVGLLQVHRALSQPEAHARQGRDYEHRGRLGVEQVKAALGLDDYDFYLCGPGAFMQTLYEGLRLAGVQDQRIHAEAFGPSTLRRHGENAQPALQQSPPASEAVPVRFVSLEQPAYWAPGSGSLLELAEANGLTPPYSCRGGSCGTCQTRVVSGQVHYPNPPAELPAAGTALICCAIPAAGDHPLVLDA